MEVSYYPGCSLDGTAKEYGESTEAIFYTLGIKLKELDDWNCCGASSAHVLNDSLSVTLPIRNLEIADKAGLDMVVPCAACYQRLKLAEKHMLAEKQAGTSKHPYSGKIHIKHLIDFMWENVGEAGLRRRIKKPLKGLKAVCYYGCLTVRPPQITDAKNPENPTAMDKLLKSLGAEVKNWTYKTDCCGGSLILTLPDTALGMTRKLFDMAKEAGADCIVTGCPMCFSNLDSWQKKISLQSGKEYNVPIFHLSELIGLSFGDSNAKKWLKRHFVDPLPLLEQKGLI